MYLLVEFYQLKDDIAKFRINQRDPAIRKSLSSITSPLPRYRNIAGSAEVVPVPVFNCPEAGARLEDGDVVTIIIIKVTRNR